MRRGHVVKVVAAIGAPALVTLFALLPRHIGTATAALLFVLAVAGVTAYGGLAAGLAASLVSFASLHYFFTPPREVLAVPGLQDLIALLAFLVVSILIGVMLATAIARGTAAERKARETQILHHVATRLLGGEPIERVLRRFVRSVEELLALAGLEITTIYTAHPIAAGVVTGEGTETFEMRVRGQTIGHLRATPARGTEIAREEQDELAVFADQLALALDSVGLASQARRAELEADQSRARAALFASITHDLRTPLASILASATTLRGDGELSAGDRVELLDALCVEAARLNRLVGNLLDLSKLRAGSLTPRTIRMPIDELVAGVVGRMERSLASRPLEVRIASDLPDVPMDVVQMDQVLTNLLENAATFAPAGSPIGVAVDRSSRGVRLSVSDRGPGIPPGEREHVFEPFIRLGNARDPGAGLGLAICRAIVELHGGSIRIEDASPCGTSIVIELPLEGS